MTNEIQTLWRWGPPHNDDSGFMNSKINSIIYSLRQGLKKKTTQKRWLHRAGGGKAERFPGRMERYQAGKTWHSLLRTAG